MFEPTGSVYLDPPTTYAIPNRPPPRRRILAARLLGFIGMTAMASAGFLAGVHYLIADPAPTAAAVNGALDSPIARAELHRELSTAIADGMVEADVSTAAAAYGIDVEAQALLVADAILDNPAFRTALDEFVIQVHDLVFVDADGPAPDATAVTDAALDVMKLRTPELADLVDPGKQVLTFDVGSLPDLTRPMHSARRALTIALIAMIAIPMAAVVHPHRHRVLAWVGRSWLVAGASVALATVVLPYLGGRVSGWTTVEVAIRAAVGRFLVPSSITALIGSALMTIAAVLKRRDQTKTSREGADVALGIGLTPSRAPVRPSDDIASRGLVDAGHPLTSM